MVNIKDVCENPDTDVTWDGSSKTLFLPSSSFTASGEVAEDHPVGVKVLDRIRVELTSDLSKRPVVVVRLLEKLD
jgi:hypothetical protein